MKKIILILGGMLFWHALSQADIQSVGDSISRTAKKTGQKIADVAQGVKGGAEAALSKTQSAFDAGMQNVKNIFLGEPKPQFCPVPSQRAYAPTVNDPQSIANDRSDDMIKTIKKYSPILYLCNERYYPIAVEDYFLHPETQLVYQKNHKKNPSAPKEVVIPRGQVTMQGIYDKRDMHTGSDYFFEIGECTKFGSNPQQFTDKKGNLTTPIYVTWQRRNGKIYISYVFLYGFNGAYPIKAPVADFPLLKGDIAGVQGAHECDLEHIVLELSDDKNRTLERIFFAVHSARVEGVWFPAHSKEISYEGTHPIVHVAVNGHGSYPRAGTHVRIFGFGNDITCKSKKWVPQLVLVYPESDSRFDPKIMGWMYHSGVYGPRGVNSFSRFIHAELFKGQSADKVQFCPNPKNPKNTIDWAKYHGCIESKRGKAGIPGK